MLSKQYKIFFFTLSALLFGLTSKGQITFNNYYNAGSGNVSFANQIEVFNEDTTYLVYAPWKNQTTNQGLRLLKLEKNGGTLIDNKFVFSNLVFATYLNNRLAIKTSQYSSLVVGDTYFGNDRGLIFCKVNNKLADTIHTKYYCDNTYAYGLSNRFIKDKNQVWYFGNKFNPNNNSYVLRPVIFKVDTNGNYIGQTEMTSLYNYGSTCVFYDSLLKLIYFGGTNYLGSPITSNVVCIDTLGNIIWNHTFTEAIGFTQLEKKNNYLVISGYKYAGYYGGNSLFRITLLKLDCNNNGSTIWQKSYGVEAVATAFHALLINNDESITAAGCYKYPNGSSPIYHDGVIFKAASNGDSLWMKTYSNYNKNIQEKFYDIKKAPDGGYILCGSPDYLNGCQSWVVKTDSLGIASGISTHINQINFSASEFKLYPNPVTDKLFLEFDTKKIDIEKIKILNLFGQTIFTIENPVSKQEIDLSLFASGVYLLNIQNKTQQVFLKVVKE